MEDSIKQTETTTLSESPAMIVDKEEWHIRKELTWGHIVTTIILIGSLLGIYLDVNTRIEGNADGIHHNTQEIQHHVELVDQSNEAMQRSIDEVKEQGKEVIKKIDKLIDYQLRHNGN